MGRHRKLRERAKELLADDPPRPPPRDEGKEDGLWERVGQYATIAPVQGDPTLEPANEPWEVAIMAGWSPDGRGHDCLYGVDDMVLGNVDATRELKVRSPTRGSPLEIGPSEDLDQEVMPRFELGYSDPYRGDWCTHL